MLTSILAVVMAATAGEEAGVRAADAAFWAAFNRCDRAAMTALIAEDIEFYHDRTGLTAGREAVVESLMKGPCGTPGLHVRREMAAETLQVDPVPGHGAILTGIHRFHARVEGEVERLDGDARFAVVWRNAGGKWEMRRVLSYAHKPA